MHPANERARLAIEKEIADRRATLVKLEEFDKKFAPIFDSPEFIACCKNGNVEDAVRVNCYASTVYIDLNDGAALRTIVNHLHTPIYKAFSKYGGSFYATIEESVAGARVFITFAQPYCKITKIEKKRLVDDSEYVVTCQQADGSEEVFDGETIEPDANA